MQIISRFWRKIWAIPLPLAIIIAALLIALAMVIEPKVKPWHYEETPPPRRGLEKLLEDILK